MNPVPDARTDVHALDAVASPPRTLDLLAATVTLSALEGSLVIEGQPGAGFVDLASVEAATVGVWEHGIGQSRDVESDELAVILAGRGTVQVDGEDPVDLYPGVLLRLRDGDRTVWTVTENLRKLYILGSHNDSTHSESIHEEVE